ncbi:MFS transporter [Syntrophorhabdus aromaticivorans]|uniref:MFS transporter n=1 Tax=Syntrophorhabdus aromaticivorans TaxID=328301 RepID=A0A971M1Q9_9BACT|nr:MFS transporter [Syntrophorhabdus aromaticivorans]NLW34118.1 MFS transporter [Syntrophorhabdus aromaticivorans]
MDKPGKARGRRSVLIVTTLSAFLVPMALSTVNVALPSIAKYFSMDAISLGWVALAFALTAGIFLVPFGKVADIHGRNKVFICGTWVFTAASFFLGIATSGRMIILFRAMQGLSAAMLFGTMIAILIAAFPIEDRGKVLGVNVAAVYLGLSLGPFLGGVLTEHLGWRSVFFLNVPLGFAAALISTWKLRMERSRQNKEPFDIVGSVIYGSALFLIMWGFSLLPAPAAFVLIAAGAGGIGIFVWWEARASSPVLDIGLFRTNKVFTLSSIAALISYSATFAIGFLLSLYLQHIKGLGPQTAGTILIAQPIVQALFSPLAGRISDRIQPRIIASTGMAVTALGLFLFAALGAGTPLSYVVVSLSLLGFGFALFSSPNMNAIMSSVPGKCYGVASSMVATMRLLGQMFSLGIAMLVFALCMGPVTISPPFYPLFLKAMKSGFAIFAFLCVGGVFASLTRGDVRR